MAHKSSVKLTAYHKRMAKFKAAAKRMGLDVTNPTWDQAYFQITGRVSQEVVEMVIEAQRAGWHPYCIGGPASGRIGWRASQTASSGTAP